MKYKHKLWTLQKNGDCIFCSRKFHNDNLLNHYIDSHEYCATCGTNCFGTERIKHGHKCVLRCQVCQVGSASLVDLERHIMEDHLQCIHCDTFREKFASKQEIVNHVNNVHLPAEKETHLKPSVLEIEYIPMQAKYNYNCSSKFALKNSPEKRVIANCQFCGFKALTNVQIQAHLAVKHRYCNVCCKQLKGINVRIHLMSEHQISIQDDNTKVSNGLSHQSVTPRNVPQQIVTPGSVIRQIVTPKNVTGSGKYVTVTNVTIKTKKNVIAPIKDRKTSQIKCDHCDWWADNEEQLSIHASIKHVTKSDEKDVVIEENEPEIVIDDSDDEPQIESHIKIEPEIIEPTEEPVRPRKRPRLPKIKCLECDFLADTESDLNEHIEECHNAILPD